MLPKKLDSSMVDAGKLAFPWPSDIKYVDFVDFPPFLHGFWITLSNRLTAA